MNSKEYWDQKIIDWEMSRYSWYGLFNPFSWSVRSRFNTALHFLNMCLKNRENLNILELGCGSGELLKRMKVNSRVLYFGFDIADSAIQKAMQTFNGSQFQFFTDDIETRDFFPKSDITVLLGVTDWISSNSLRRLLCKLESEYLMVSYTEKKKGLRSKIYNLYRSLNDKSTNQTTTFTSKGFGDLCRSCGWKLEADLSRSSMSPGRLLWLKKDTSI